MKDLTKEMYFSTGQSTTKAEIAKLAVEMLNTTWTFDIFRYEEPKMINLALLGWKFDFDNKKTAKGTCSKSKKTIFISEWLLKQNLDKALSFENTLRHEIAHAIDFETRGTSDHGRIWKAIARKVLCDAERCYSSDSIKITEETKYTVVCDNCGKKEPSHKRIPKIEMGSVACGKCCRKHNNGKFSKDYILRQVQNY